MPQRLTLGDARPAIAKVIGVCSTDARVPELLNDAVQRLMARGKWVGTYARYRICINANCLTWPRQIETIEAYSICDRVGRVHNVWFEFLLDGPGPINESDNWGDVLVDTGEAIAFDDVGGGGNKKLKFYCDVPEAATARIFIQYYSNGNWVRTQNLDGTWNNGEWVSLSTIPSYSQYVCDENGWVGVQKPITNGTVRVYEYDTVTTAQKALAFYEPDETRPIYRRSIVPGLTDMQSCPDTVAPCAKKAVTVMAKLRFIPVINDDDYLMIGNLPALKEMVHSILKADRNVFDEAEIYEQRAIRELQMELKSHYGDGVTAKVRFEDRALWGGGADHISLIR